MKSASTKKIERDDDVPEIDLTNRRWKVLGRGLHAKRVARMPLAAIRKAAGVTQEAMARALETDQGEVSRIEHRDDWRVSTLRKIATALGAKIEVTFVFKGGQRVTLDE